MAGGACAFGLGSYGNKLRAEGATDWSKRIGIQLTVVRDEMSKDVESTLAQLAAIGYRFVNPVGFSGLDAKAYRAILDRHGLTAPQIDLGFSTGAGMEEDMEACQILGIKYAEPAVVGTAQRGSARGGGATDPYRGPAGGFRRPATPPPQTEDDAKRAAAEYNGYGKTARKFGIKVIFHNHIEHFELLSGSKSTFFDVFLSETDPDTVGLELDLGYTAIAGRNIPETIRQYPGRFPVWDVRDAFGIKIADANPAATPNQRRQYTYSVPVGLGEVDFKTIFAGAETAGLKYFFVLQDNAAAWGDSMAVARVSWQNLTKILT
jgi:sugar phosphate isomerase/epimerase